MSQQKTVPTPEQTKVAKKQTFRAINHENVYGKTTYYVRLEQEGNEPIHIQIGETNYNKIKAITDETQGNKVDNGNKTR